MRRQRDSLLTYQLRNNRYRSDGFGLWLATAHPERVLEAGEDNRLIRLIGTSSKGISPSPKLRSFLRQDNSLLTFRHEPGTKMLPPESHSALLQGALELRIICGFYRARESSTAAYKVIIAPVAPHRKERDLEALRAHVRVAAR